MKLTKLAVQSVVAAGTLAEVTVQERKANATVVTRILVARAR